MQNLFRYIRGSVCMYKGCIGMCVAPFAYTNGAFGHTNGFIGRIRLAVVGTGRVHHRAVFIGRLKRPAVLASRLKPAQAPLGVLPHQRAGLPAR